MMSTMSMIGKAVRLALSLKSLIWVLLPPSDNCGKMSEWKRYQSNICIWQTFFCKNLVVGPLDDLGLLDGLAIRAELYEGKVGEGRGDTFEVHEEHSSPLSLDIGHKLSLPWQEGRVCRHAWVATQRPEWTSGDPLSGRILSGISLCYISLFLGCWNIDDCLVGQLY